MSKSAAQTARRRALSSLPAHGPPSQSGTSPAASKEALLGGYVWRRFLTGVPWDERLLRAAASVRRGARTTYSMSHGPWSLSLAADGASVSNWIFGAEPARLDLEEFEREVETRLDPCQACGSQARFPRLRGWTEYRLRDGAAVFLCPECAAAEPAAA